MRREECRGTRSCVLAVALVLALLPAAQLVASVLGAASTDLCSPGEKNDVCPGHCCTRTPHACHCHDNPCIAGREPRATPVVRRDVEAVVTSSHRGGRGYEPPPVPPPIA